MNALDPHFHIQLNEKLVWHWRSITKSKLFEALQANLRKHGYSLTTNCAQRIEKGVEIIHPWYGGMTGLHSFTYGGLKIPSLIYDCACVFLYDTIGGCGKITLIKFWLVLD